MLLPQITQNILNGEQEKQKCRLPRIKPRITHARQEHRNLPGIVSNVSTLISGRGINIQNMLNKSRGDMAVTVLELSQQPDETLLAALGKLNNVVRVRLISK